MSARLICLNLLLLAGAGLLMWQLRREWLGEKAREQALYRYRVRPTPATPVMALKKPAPFDAGTYAEIAQNNLFSRDRNPNVIVDVQPPPPPQPPPPFPVARGVMLWGGVPPTIVLSEKAGGPQKGYHTGETIGPWKVLSIDERFVTFGWDGKEFKKRIDELLDRTPIEVAVTPPAAAAPAAAAQPANANLAKNDSGMGVEIGTGIRACVAGDKAAPGTVVDGYKKVVSQTPFGTACRWEEGK